MVEKQIESARIHRPDDEFGSPFLIDFGSAALYTYRYGEFASDEYEGISVRTRWLRERLIRRAPPEQGLLEHPDIPAVPTSDIVLLAWAGNRSTGLERAFFGRPYLDDGGLLSWLRPIDELDPEEGQSFALPGIEDAHEPPRHSLEPPEIADIEAPPPFGLELLDYDAQRVRRPKDYEDGERGRILDDNIEEDDED